MNINLHIPDGYEVDVEKSTWTDIILKEKSREVKSWEDLKAIRGYFVSSLSFIANRPNVNACGSTRNTFRTKEQAEASIALAMLSQLMFHANEGWEPNWLDRNNKHSIVVYEEKLIFVTSSNCRHFLAFKTEKVRDAFLENHRDLIMKAIPLL